MRDEMTAILAIYKWPSQAFWRYFEFKVLKEIHYERPILEIGCGDGQLSSLIFDKIDEGIDVNPRSIDRCRRLSGHVYVEMRCQDARDLQPINGGYGTVFANCVVEHVPDIERVLDGCFRGLRLGGSLVITVPLKEMNSHLLFPWDWYARLRQRQLVHVNLFTRSKWLELLERVGFSQIEFRPYLSARECKLWDALDSPGCIGSGRYCVATAVCFLGARLMPKSARRWLLRHTAEWLSVKASRDCEKGPACASVIVARKN